MAETIRDLKPSTSCGVDGFTAHSIKNAGPSIITLFAHIFNCSIEQGFFPNKWKTRCVNPLFEEGDGSDPTNYRPVTIMPAFAKLLERIAHTQLYAFYRLFQFKPTWVQEGLLHWDLLDGFPQRNLLRHG